MQSPRRYRARDSLFGCRSPCAEGKSKSAASPLRKGNTAGGSAVSRGEDRRLLSTSTDRPIGPTRTVGIGRLRRPLPALRIDVPAADVGGNLGWHAVREAFVEALLD